MAIRFSPKYPKKVLQLSSTDMALKNTQKYFYALDLEEGKFTPSIDDGINILESKIKEAEGDRTLDYVASTFDFQNNMVRDGTLYDGKRIITFSNILKHESFPLAEILRTILEVGQKEMNNPIEIEFAVELDVEKGTPKIFNFLQIRPIVESTEEVEFDIDTMDKDDALIVSESALGNGIIDDVCDIVYIKPESFNAAKSTDIADRMEHVNAKFVEENLNYILVGPGRWGSSDPWLGIPVKWSQISAARVIIESGLENYRIDPSQGTHFFQNLTSFRVGYFTINPYINDGYYDIDYLSKQEAIYEDEFIRHIRFKKPLVIKIDGKNNKGMILKA